MTVNCRSLRSQQQKNELTTLIDTYKPHIIHATETHLDKTISIVEIIDTNIYEVCRKDRVFKPGHEERGVLNLVRKDLLSTADITLDTDCEILWNKIELKSRKPLYTGCYYRQPDNNIDVVESLNTSLTRLTHSNNLPNIIQTDEFNMPDIKWKRDDSNNFQIKTNNNYNMEINNMFVEALEENCLNQAVTEPTRQHNILDLVLTTNPSIIENISVEDGMSDHKVVITDINIKTKPRKTVPRKVYIYKKANMNGINQHLDKENNVFTNNSKTNSIQECWGEFKEILLQAITTNIPTKILTSRWNVPWITREIKTLIRKKQRIYNKAKRMNNEKHWE
jgi:hypothetical protein